MTRTPTTCYEIPILEVLYDLGGCGYRAGSSAMKRPESASCAEARGRQQ